MSTAFFKDERKSFMTIMQNGRICMQLHFPIQNEIPLSVPENALNILRSSVSGKMFNSDNLAERNSPKLSKFYIFTNDFLISKYKMQFILIGSPREAGVPPDQQNNSLVIGRNELGFGRRLSEYIEDEETVPPDQRNCLIFCRNELGFGHTLRYNIQSQVP